ncbi:thermonuclease family protein [Fischerella thermalis]|uniref:Nuclease n=1 Tax=Fischerella thermalis CCMEE 5318 TaxID=2019666 RepID=A0A2N6LIS9_9CYAN|nr:thermonuclease family protein [Fischerella thermalis]PMB24285.1 nuclease [Fischerella thermalis CCMEE 5318]PMB36654.1 nuclease [Fischerella thermalis CCMEE 5319]
MKKIVILFCLLLLVVACQPRSKSSENAQVQVKVAQVVSGQTIEVFGMGDQPNLISQVRLLGIDAPDLQQRPWGNAAKEHLQALIQGDPVTLEFDVERQDKFGRTLAYVWKDKVLLNEQLVKEGQALFVGRSPNHKYDQRLERAQQWARIMGLGIWNPEKPMRFTPAEFRRQNR